MVVIDSTPESGALVLVGGLDRGPAPVTVLGLEAGSYDVVLKHDRYKRTIQSITVKGEPEERFSIAMEPLVGYLSLESTPTGADVYIDGEKAGTTPLPGRPLQVGDHSYELRLENYYPISGTFTAEDNFKHEFKHEFKAMEAELNVFSRPTGAQVWINNMIQSQITPAKFKLKPGDYLVTVHTPKYVEQEQIVHLETNEVETVQLKMEPGAVPQGMVLVPGGDFLMGNDDRAPDERPRRVVNVKPFYIDKFEVTNQDFKKVFPDHEFHDGEENYPAVDVSWTEAMKYAQAVGKRLPTEAEWEKAARSTDAREYPWGPDWAANMANTREQDERRTIRVGQLFNGTSACKCVDMSGNVYEWVLDWYEAYPGNPVVTKDYGQIYRVLRGGSFMTGNFEARCAARHFDRMDASRKDYGLRCAMDVSAQ
jgi:formylglycine-generating enzyme required for sulfatase activity